MADLFAEEVRAEVPGAAVQPAVLSGAGMPWRGAALAGSETAAEVPIPT